MTRPTPTVFTIPPGLSFADALARSLLHRHRDNPLALSHIRILLPNRRSARALREAFLRANSGVPLLLPRMMPVGDVEEDSLDITGLASDSLDLPPAILETERLFLLARLTLGIPQGQGRPSSLAGALKLARDLARLIDSVHTERLDFAQLQDLAPEELAAHWQHTLTFLEVITEQWPKLLASLGKSDPSSRRNRLLDALTEQWRTNRPKGK